MVKFSQIAIPLFIISIMVFSVIGFMWGGNLEENNSIQKDEYGLTKINDKWILEKEGTQYAFDYHPSELKEIQVEPFTLDSPKYYLIFDPEDKDNNLDYSLEKLYSLLKKLNLQVFLACSENCEMDIPVKNCSESSFYFKKSNQTEVYMQDKCVVIAGDVSGWSKSIDKIGYLFLGVMNG